MMKTQGELTLKTECYLPTLVGIAITRESSLAEWENYGYKIRTVDEARQWIIGDWLVDGKQHYGDGLYKRAAKITGLKEQTLMDFTWMANIYEFSFRKENIGYTHHKEVASLKRIAEDDRGKLYLSDEADKDKIAELLTEAEKRGLTVVELRNKVREWKEWQRQQIAIANEPEKYAVIYTDPPWQYTSGDQHSDEEQETVLADHYPSMSLSDICALPQARLAASDCVLFLWCTSPVLEEAFQVINAWGFKYKASMIWDKVAHNVGHYVSVRHEMLLIATKGQPPKVPRLADSVYVEERTQHSRKPDYFRQLIRELYPEGKRIELFFRGTPEPEWDAWGNETEQVSR